MKFYKYQGTGNDFVMINGVTEQVDLEDVDQIAHWCDRRFGIGGDGCIVLVQHPDYDFEMKYFNADGRLGSMCGNGGRCAVAFAHQQGFFKGESCRFLAYDGLHSAIYHPSESVVELSMSDVEGFELGNLMTIMDTGSPHYVTLVEDLDDIDIVEAGRAIRYSDRFSAKGINVNFVELKEGRLDVATYERGVENETLSCGTGVTASALSFHLLKQEGRTGEFSVPLKTKGGELAVDFSFDGQAFTNIWLKGKATFVFAGEMN